MLADLTTFLEGRQWHVLYLLSYRSTPLPRVLQLQTKVSVKVRAWVRVANQSQFFAMLFKKKKMDLYSNKYSYLVTLRQYAH